MSVSLIFTFMENLLVPAPVIGIISYFLVPREPLVIFSGGMSYDKAGRTPSVTVMNGKSTTVLEMEHNVVDFVVLCETPWQNGESHPARYITLNVQLT